jgi:hypothetical protein
MKILVSIIILLLFTCNLYPQSYFIENRGQWQPSVRFVGQSTGYNVIVTDKDILIDVPDYSAMIKDSIQDHYKHSGYVYRLQAISDGTEKQMITSTIEIRGVNKQTTYFNYFIGNDSAKWFTRVPSFRTLEFKDSGRDASISLEISGKKLLLCYTDEAAPITDILLITENKIPVSFNNLITKTKNITYTFDISDLLNITCRNKKAEKDKILCEEHDDRNLVFSSYLGGPNMEQSGQMYVDKDGSCYLTGYAERDFPTSPGSYKEIDTVGILSGYISKISPDGKTLLYSTYLSSIDASYLLSIKCDKYRNIYVGGYADSQYDYPMTNNALQQQGNRNLDFIISKLDPSGTKLLYSTFLGGSDMEDVEVNFIEVDDEENIYLVGISRSKDYPVTDYCLKDTMSGDKDIVITKINTITGKLVYSTFFGGKGHAEYVSDIILDSEGCIYMGGNNALNDFPVTEGVIKDSIAPDMSSAFISKLSNDGNSLVFSSYFGGTSLQPYPDKIKSIDVGGNGNIFISGTTFSANFPITTDDLGIRPVKYTSLFLSLFLTELDPNCSAIIHSTCINKKITNETPGFEATKITYDGNYVWISGISGFNDFTATEGAFQKEGSSFFMKVSYDFRKILYLSYIENNHIEDHDWRDEITDMAINNGCELYLYGYTFNYNFPVSIDSFQPWYGGAMDAFIMKFDMTTVGVDEHHREVDYELINIYPNPAVEYIEIRLDDVILSEAKDLKIYNALGGCVKNLTPTLSEGEGARINVSGLPPGVYYMKYGTYINKFVKM